MGPHVIIIGGGFAGLDAAKRVGFKRIKLNAVAVKNLVEADIVPLARYARENGFEVRYIEFMPLDSQGLWDRDKVLLADDILAELSREIAPLEPILDPDPRAPASPRGLASAKCASPAASRCCGAICRC